MSDIFISYASEDRSKVQALAEVLESMGWSVWWDRAIPAGTQFDKVIEKELAAARCVIVIWSKTSVVSQWVRAEAGEALRRDVLIPALIGDVEIPLVFRQIQAAKLTGANRNTIKDHLSALTDARHLARHGKGRGTWYSLA